jgi:hypothetical protein
MATSALTNLKGLEIFGQKISINFSKHTHINATTGLTQDNSDDDLMKDFSRTNLNRFSKASTFAPSTGGKKTSRYMCQPTSTLHVSNIDASVDEKELIKMFANFGELEGERVYEHNAKRMALIKFKQLSESAEALANLHNTSMGGKSIKIAFSMNKL